MKRVYWRCVFKIKDFNNYRKIRICIILFFVVIFKIIVVILFWVWGGGGGW